MKKLFLIVFVFAVLLAQGCSDSHRNLEDFPEIVPDEPISDEPVDDPVVEPADELINNVGEVEELEFDTSKLTESKYSDAVEDLKLLSVEPTVLSKDNMVDITISFGDGLEVASVDGVVYPTMSYDWEMEVFLDGTWYSIWGDLEKFIPAEYSFDYDYAFDIPAIRASSPDIWPIKTGTVLSGLPVGRYRIVKDVDGWKYAEFVIE